MATIISASIDVTKIDKKKLVEGKNGAKYYNIQVMINDEPDKYGNTVTIAENQTKDAREAGEKKNYLGNGKVVWSSESKKAAEKLKEQKEGDLPF